jgi:hypothetical protein
LDSLTAFSADFPATEESKIAQAMAQAQAQAQE